MPIQNPRRGEAAAAAAATIVVEIPARLKHLVAAIEDLIESVGKRADQLGRDGRAVDYAAIERGYAELSDAIETAAHQCTLAAGAAAVSEPQRVEVRGEAYTRVGEGIGTFRTMTGASPCTARSTAGLLVDSIALQQEAAQMTQQQLFGNAQANSLMTQRASSRDARQPPGAGSQPRRRYSISNLSTCAR